MRMMLCSSFSDSNTRGVTAPVVAQLLQRIGPSGIHVHGIHVSMSARPLLSPPSSRHYASTHLRQSRSRQPPAACLSPLGVSPSRARSTAAAPRALPPGLLRLGSKVLRRSRLPFFRSSRAVEPPPCDRVLGGSGLGSATDRGPEQSSRAGRGSEHLVGATRQGRISEGEADRCEAHKE
jgi:hypothetical protein